MHKQLLSIPLLILSLFAQAQKANEFGIKSGISSSYLAFDTSGTGNTVNTKKMGGFYMSVFTDMYQQEAFSAIVSFGIIEKGGYETVEIKNSNGFVIGSNTIDYPFRYLSLAIEGKLKIKLEELPNLYPYLAVGPRLDYLLSYPNRLDYTIRPIVLGANIGFGFDYDFPKISAMAEFRKLYNFNTNISHRPNVTIRDNTFYIAIGIKYPFHKK